MVTDPNLNLLRNPNLPEDVRKSQNVTAFKIGLFMVIFIQHA